MKNPYNRQRMVSMHKMLFEMARGNFNNQIPLSSNDDEIETLVVLVNMVAEELKESAFHSGFVNPYITHRMVTPATFILDENHSIKDVNQGALKILGYDSLEMLSRPIQEFLLDDFADMTDLEKKALEELLLSGEIITLNFITYKKLIVSAECSVSRLSEGKFTVLSFIAPFLQLDDAVPASYETKEQRPHNFRKTDARLMQRVYDYVLANLAEPLPSIKEIARLFGTNDFKLKDGFRHFFHTSVYKFYTEQRLQRAYLMIEQTDILLKNIAFMNGFNSYPNFSKSFKKQFGFSPKELGRGKTGGPFPLDDLNPS
ncbi:helix-turn-helix domain-containing protein [Flavobacterium sp. LHD-80]|uniref:helix-turn-helix domain-containing protein n=1 Tax=Flavobacterium sp. LHD-80 TaxID=3071411 RepID=UPI0027DF8A8F|nr:helix-turn-helix domain-containing protein [Flavobacterium sp. LHD-80]MDQ6472746.1 helix-turn-helix domain-containing protein [Flavobacterium sp. LHD-80]